MPEVIDKVAKIDSRNDIYSFLRNQILIINNSVQSRKSRFAKSDCALLQSIHQIVYKGIGFVIFLFLHVTLES